MCGRYGRRSDKQKIAEAFAVRKNLDHVDFAPGDDIPPGEFQPVVRVDDEGERDIELMYWGFNFPKRFTFILAPTAFSNPEYGRTPSRTVAALCRRTSSSSGSACIRRTTRNTRSPHPDARHLAWQLSGVCGRTRMTTLFRQSRSSHPSRTRRWPRSIIASLSSLEPRDYKEWLTPADRPPLHLLRILPADEMNIRLMEAHNMELPLNSA